MTYEVKLRLTGEVFICEEGELLGLIDDYPLMTFKDGGDDSPPLNIEEESLDDFLLRASTNLELVYDPVKLSKKTIVDNLEQALVYIESDYWDCKFKRFDETLFMIPIFIEKIINHPGIKSFQISKFPRPCLINEEILRMLVSSPKWNGKALYLLDSNYSENINNIILDSPYWNGIVRCENVSRYNIIKRIVEDPRWSGRCTCFSYDVINDHVPLLKKIINHQNWNGNLFPLTENSCTELFYMIIESPKWKGNCSFLSERHDNDVEYVRAIINSSKWNGRVKFFFERLSSEKSLALEIVKSPKWCCNNLYYFDGDVRNDLEFCNSVIKSPNWNGSCRFFGPLVLNNTTIMENAIDSPKWNKNISDFGENVMNDLNLVIKIKMLGIKLKKKNKEAKDIRVIL